MAPEVGFEPTTNRLTADRSTTELLRSVVGQNSNCGARRFKVKSAPVVVMCSNPRFLFLQVHKTYSRSMGAGLSGGMRHAE